MEQDRSLMTLLYRVQQGLQHYEDLETRTTNYTEDQQGVYAVIGGHQQFFPLQESQNVNRILSEFRQKVG